MAHTLGVAVLKGANNLTIDTPSIILIHSTVWLRFQKTVSRSSSHELHYKDNLVFSFDGFVELSNMRMIKALHEFDFSSNGFLPLNFFHLFFQIDLQSNFLIRLFVHADVDGCIGPLAYLFADDVVIQ